MSIESIEGFQLSPQQEHLWLLQQIDQSQAYRSQCAILIEGNVDINNLELAFQDVVNRHEILSTYFPCLPGMIIPVQAIANHRVTLAQTYNLSSYSEREQEAKVETLFQEFSQLPFNFEQGSLLQTSLIALSPNKHLLLIGLPSLCADRTTISNLVQEIGCAYSAKLRGEQLSDQPIQYVDFSQWQHQILKASETKIGREYWCKQDFSALETLKLPHENHISETGKFAPKLINSLIPPHLAAEIEFIAQKYHTDSSIFLLSCWQILLWKIIGQLDIIIGTAINGRKYQELQQALGLFTQYVPINCHLENNLKFSQILQQVCESLKDVSKWQECFTWKQIAESHNQSFFPFCFEFVEESAKYSESGITFSIYKQYTCTDRFNIKLSCKRSSDFLITEFNYDSHLREQDIQNLAEQFNKLVESAVNNPETAISELEILSDRALHQILVEFNQTKTNYPQNKCIHHLFEEQVERTPNNIAIKFANQQLTYTQLNTKANQLAHYLQQLGVRPEVLVGICIERSPLMLIGILGILKAGGAYVPIDPAYPQQRLALMLEDTQISVLLTQQQLLEGLPTQGIQTICLDTDEEIFAKQNQENLTSRVDAENLAYVIYTSGSTGKPKGVQITHRNLVHSTTARIAYYQKLVTSFLLLSSFAFDSSVAGIFWTLCSGGILYLPEEGVQREIPKLIELIDQNQISHLLSLPSLYSLILQQAKPEKLASLNTVIVAGESCPPELLQLNYKLRSETSLFNEYGPTEGTVWSSVYYCLPEMPDALMRSPVSIGRPIANTQIYLLDSRLYPVPVGVAGELWISGEGLSRGYLNQPITTAEKFIPNPFSQKSGTRLYKTGDLARYLPDGNIEFLGRIDHQVKIRGYRIELGEIEAVLSQHPAVQEIIVLAQKDELNDQRLVAYLVINQQPIPAVSELRQFLNKKLPEYMLPSAFVFLKSLPLLPNGKVNLEALPEQVQLDLEENFVAPQSELEQTIATIWQQVLHLEKVSIHHNFFDVGGHSLLMVQIHSKLRETFLRDISMVEMFQYPTVSTLAKYLSQQLAEQTSLGQSPDVVESRRDSKKQQRQLRQQHRETINHPK